MVRTRRAAVRGERSSDDAFESTKDKGSSLPSEDHDTTEQPAPLDHEAKTFTIPFGDKELRCQFHGTASTPSLIFTHGAGGGITTPACFEFAHGFSSHDSILTFEGNMNLKSRTKAFNTTIEHVGFDKALGGRSMGARAACLATIQDDRRTEALVLVSFPLVSGKKGESRENALLELPEEVDVLFISGDRDSMCDLPHLRSVIQEMKARCWIVTVEGADHGMDWRPKACVQDMRRRTGSIAAEWLRYREAGKRYSCLSWDANAEAIQFDGWKDDVQTMLGVNDHDDAHEDEDSKEQQPPAKKRKRGKK
ncbi:hypothetical protein LTR62_003746 [Meristemomyces frigidus]|uniref:KANL3/Tex30 alpha/beta hydrolase-like domain-containing protein n=1 Tax=Meristemomyces frigidus TaxID=1508187 RepID=A0AAN7YPH2_9PEZI|nr:hypothetical protein LTR62_003746 [Meristemomyces frigidus]